MNPLQPVPLKNTAVTGGFWKPRVERNRQQTLQHEYQELCRTGRIDAIRLDWQPGKPKPHIFWDSDVAKWMEAAAYSLATQPDDKLQAQLEAVIDLLEKAQQPDGYLNSYFNSCEPDKRWTNLQYNHELYCAGHLMEAATAYHDATGDERFLKIMQRYADNIAGVFGAAPEKKRGYPGHEEIELALLKLWRATGETKYLDLAKFFLDERGQTPHYFDLEREARGESERPAGPINYNRHEIFQAHLPVRQQKSAEGHSVRAVYLYSAMTEVAAATDDEELLACCLDLWENVTQKRMYVTGGIGSTPHGERFTFDYDLPEETAYAETCAAIGLVFWAHRLLQIMPNRKFADLMERTIYNGILSGVSLDGSRFFYENPMAVTPYATRFWNMNHRTGEPGRQEWFGCACCPPNIARFLASFGNYIYSTRENSLWVHLFADSEVNCTLNGADILLQQRTEYPWQDTTVFTIQTKKNAEFDLALRVPEWCSEAKVAVNGKNLNLTADDKDGYLHIRRIWQNGDQIAFRMPMPVMRIEAHPAVRQIAGRVALQRGPLIYCVEEIDNGANLWDLRLPDDAEFHPRFDPELLGGAVIIEASGLRSSTSDSSLYRTSMTGFDPVTIRAIPYCLWANRDPGEMRIWLLRMPT